MNVKGFTLVELLITILLIGILAAVAFSFYNDLTSDSKLASAQSIAGSLSSANSINYAAWKSNPTKGLAVVNCTDVASLLTSALPSGYQIQTAIVNPNETITCQLIISGTNLSVPFVATGIGTSSISSGNNQNTKENNGGIGPNKNDEKESNG